MFPFAGGVLEPAARAGFVTVRIDKPGQGDSEGPLYKELAFGSEKDAYLQALRLAKSYDFVDRNRVAIFGHSMGGCFGPLVAAEEPVKAVIVTGTLFKTFGEYMLENSRRQAEMGGATADAVDQGGRETLKAVYHLFEQGLSLKEMAEKHPEMAGWARGNTPDMETYSGVGIPFFRELSQTNLAKAWTGVSADVLAIYCANDFLSGQDDHERIAAAANKRRAGSGEFKLLADSDHLFRKTTSPLNSLQTWGQPGELNPSISGAVLEYLKRKL
jgi:pimeloyl-ACP methyl ester carboxylesterase